MVQRSKRHRILNSLATAGYLICCLQWLIALAVLGPIVIESDLYKTYVNNPHQTVVKQVEPTDPDTSNSVVSMLAVIIAVVVALGALVAGVISVLKLPRAVGRGGAKLTRTSVTILMSFVMQHRTLSDKKRRRLSARLLFYIKIALVLLPCVLTLVLPSPSIIAPELVQFSAAVLALGAISAFSLQAGFAKQLHIDQSLLW